MTFDQKRGLLVFKKINNKKKKEFIKKKKIHKGQKFSITRVLHSHRDVTASYVAAASRIVLAGLSVLMHCGSYSDTMGSPTGGGHKERKPKKKCFAVCAD